MIYYTALGNSVVAVSAGAVILILVLVVQDIRDFMTLETIETMEVDTKRNAQMRINFDLSFPKLPCSMVNVDAEDVTKSPHKGLMHNVFKRRLDKYGKSTGTVERNSLGNTLTSEEELKAAKERDIASGRPTITEADAASAGTDCPSCYGAGSPGQCCQTCDEIRELYRQKGWSFDPSGVEQCKREGLAGDIASGKEEGCNIYGYIKVPKVAGNIHFAPGHGFSSLFGQHEDLMALTHGKFNATHSVNSFSFGRFYPSRVSPLDGVYHEVGDGAAMYQYFLKVVPTEYRSLSGNKYSTYQYSATSHQRHLNLETQRGLPGVYLYYDLSPIRVRIRESSQSLGHLLTGLVAIVGGVMSLAGFADSLIHQASQSGQVGGRRSRLLG